MVTNPITLPCSLARAGNEHGYEFTKFVVLCRYWLVNDDPDASNKEITELLSSLY